MNFQKIKNFINRFDVVTASKDGFLLSPAKIQISENALPTPIENEDTAWPMVKSLTPEGQVFDDSAISGAVYLSTAHFENIDNALGSFDKKKADMHCELQEKLAHIKDQEKRIVAYKEYITRATKIKRQLAERKQNK